MIMSDFWDSIDPPLIPLSFNRSSDFTDERSVIRDVGSITNQRNTLPRRNNQFINGGVL